MSDEDAEKSRVLAACEGCGAVFAAIKLANGSLQPISGCSGCPSCGGTDVSPVSGVGDTDSVDAVED